ncbi:hypothetical protein [Pseudomonas sp. dw_612]|uniref:hypothetical protein n=1 Tax=Pseudomonas sp. dw_612 TaxID=2720080 RepID=UPI001BD33463|nr:hypothetical protein [Pseudomonas sp. dw_612]
MQLGFCIFLRFFTLMLFCALCSGCLHLDVPPARIEFVSINHDRYSLYDVRFTSDRDLIHLYEAHGRSGQIGTSLHCSLNGDLDFSVEHKIALEGYGRIEGMRLIEGDRRYEILASVRFENNEDRSGLSYIAPAELVRLLEPQDYMPCKVVITAFPFKAYYSKVMYVPTSRIIAEVKNPRIAPRRVSLKPADRPLTWLQFEPVCIVRWREELSPAYDQIDDVGLCRDVPYAGLLASFAPSNKKLRLVTWSDQTPKPLTAYTLIRGDGRREPGISAENGDTHLVGSMTQETLKAEVGADIGAREIWTPQIDESQYVGGLITY